jgi:hypothetical protein
MRVRMYLWILGITQCLSVVLHLRFKPLCYTTVEVTNVALFPKNSIHLP